MTNGFGYSTTFTVNVDWIKVDCNFDQGWLRASGILLILWRGADNPTAQERIMHSMWISLLEHALVHNLQVTIAVTEEYPGKVAAVQLNAS